MRAASCLVTLASIAFDPSPSAARPTGPESTTRPAVVDVDRRIDVNDLNMFVTNRGSFAFDLRNSDAGLYYPIGTDKSLVFAAGLWLGAYVNTPPQYPYTPSAVVAEYSQEYVPGAMAGGTFTDPGNPAYVVYKVSRFTGNPADTAHVTRGPGGSGLFRDPLVHHSWSEYMVGAVPHGAPWTMHRFDDTSTPAAGDSVDVPGPDVLGDQMLWTVYNDADPGAHTNDAGGAPVPFGIEVQQATFGFESPGALRDVVFLRYRLINKGTNTLRDLYAAQWSDPDVGGAAGFTDDLVGCDTTLALGFCYNATNHDGGYGSAPPAIGFQVLRGGNVGTPALPRHLGMTSFNRFINGTDPSSARESYDYMRGLDLRGAPVVDPVTRAETRYVFGGDPLAPSQLEWLDGNPADRRMMLSSGPFTMSPGDTQDVWVAVIVGAGTDRLASIGELRCTARYVRDVFALGFPRPLPEPGPGCSAAPPPNCPRPAAYWATECAAPNHLRPGDLQSVGSRVVDGSAFLFRPGGPGFCDFVSVGPGSDLRARAMREFAAFRANVVAGSLSVHEDYQWEDSLWTPGAPIRLWSTADVVGGCLGAFTVGELAQPGTRTRSLYAADYLDANPEHRRALEGVDWGGPAFGGGAGYGWDFFGGTLDPATSPDSFATVELRFSRTATQKAYRYFRKQQANGSAPSVGRGYDFAGFHPINLQAWDTVHNVQLDVMFVEKLLTTADGTYLPDAQQFATTDSTWAPSPDGDGGREYLVVTRRPYSDTPKPAFMVDGAFSGGLLPTVWALWARLRTATDVIDDGDAFRFAYGLPPLPGVDQRLIRLENQPLSDPAVTQEYQDIVDCLAALNAGDRLGSVCDAPTPTLLALVLAEASRDRVRLAWHATENGLCVTIERREPGAGWAPLARAFADGTGRISYEDRDVRPGGRYGYRLVVSRPAGAETAGEAWVDVPFDRALAVRSLRLEGARVVVALTLESHAAARIELIDVAGRRVWQRALEPPSPGDHDIVVDRELRPGLYFVRLVQGDRRVTLKGVLVK